jgi:Glycogen debranching enzyme
LISKIFFLNPVELELNFYFDNDFADIFEVRGHKRERKGKFYPLEVKKDKIKFPYKGLDNIIRETIISFSPFPVSILSTKATYKIKLNPKESYTLYLTIECLIEKQKLKKCSYKKAFYYIKKRVKDWENKSCKIHTSNEQFNQWLKRSWADIVMLTTSTEYGVYPYAGIPWFNTIFGRDGIITALECLWISPIIAKGTLAFLAHHQSKEFNPEQDAEPGKIVHEIRKGELARTGEIPYAKYYGSIDATPLFVILASKYLKEQVI